MIRPRAHNTAGQWSGGDSGLGHVFNVFDGAQGVHTHCPPWMDDSTCGDSNVDMTQDPPSERQRAVCDACPVLKSCRAELFRNRPKEIVGTWAGIRSDEWKAIRKQLIEKEKEDAAQV